jgi:hypothetical protein
MCLKVDSCVHVFCLNLNYVEDRLLRFESADFTDERRFS